MHPDHSDNRDPGNAAEGAREGWRAGLIVSVALHALALSAIILVLGLAADRDDAPIVVPVNIVELGPRTVSPTEPVKAEVPEQTAAPPSSPDAKPIDLSARQKQPPPDDLEIKLRKLAQLREPMVDVDLARKGEGLSRASAMRQDAALGPEAKIKDFLRDQIEHHWSPDLASLHGRNVSVPILVAITTKTGVVTRAEIVNNPQAGFDSGYDEIAVSARNAALLSSPLTLPPGHYPESMQVILTLNTADALR
jgi:outer membrane biosynthesis protein TonB